MFIKSWVETRKGREFEVLLPAKRIVCWECNGSGTELRGGLKGAVISEENFNDDDFRQSYFGGDYDVKFSCCNGRNVIEVVDEDALTDKMRERYYRAQDTKARNDAEVIAERRYFQRAYGY